ncbi:MAG: glycine cleavage system aminomethyltransferase GcvT [Alphaproteobacteria bacterium]|nr:glycine cleavage system aminomethyltransferase GcvT [Alphaproteobacteria bacterium]
MPADPIPVDQDLLTTPLDALHRRLGAKMVPFAGYAMPVQYPAGVLQEHQWTRQSAGLFDVSHMGQVRLSGSGAAEALERLVPGDIQALAPGRQRYTLFTNDAGGILDDLMVTHAGDHLYLVVNAACKHQDLAHLQAHLEGVTITAAFDRALLALQGPEAKAVMAELAPGSEALPFMAGAALSVAGELCFVTRSGYTGEDGFEISVAADAAAALAERLLADPRVKPIGLGARDSLRLEAGLCLYGHDIDTTTSPIEAGLAWTISKRRRAEGGYPGAARVAAELASGPTRRRVGIRPEDKAPAREGTQVLDSAGATIGTITSGGFGPTVGGPVAMGYVTAAHATPGTEVQLLIRGTPRPARVVPMPFAPHRYHRG